MMKPSLDDLEQSVGAPLRRALTPVPVPPEALERMRQRLSAPAACSHNTAATAPLAPETARLEPAPVATVPPAPQRRRWLRWVAAAAAAAVVMTAGWPQAGRLQRRWFGPQASFPIGAPFTLGGVAMAGTAPTPALHPWLQLPRIELAAPLPELPATGQVLRAEVDHGPAWVERVRRNLGLKESTKPMWDKMPVLSPVIGHHAGPLAQFRSGAWSYQAGASWGEPVPAGSRPPDPPAGAEIEEDFALESGGAWLKQAGLYPQGDLVTHVWQDPDRRDTALVEWRPGPDHALTGSGDFPRAAVTVRSSGEVFMARGLWPSGTSPAGEVRLRTAREAWEDVKAGIGVALGGPSFQWAENPVITVRTVALDRALVRALDNRWYYIPVVAFMGETVDARGATQPVHAYVSAVKPMPGQGGYRLAADLSRVSTVTEAPLLTLNRKDDWYQPWQPPAGIDTFTIPTDEAVTAATARLIGEAGLDPKKLGAPVIERGPVDLHVTVPWVFNGLPARQTMGDPQWVGALYATFEANGRIRNATIGRLAPQNAGEPLALLSPQEAWERVKAGEGTVSVRMGGTFPNAHFAAHETTIDRVELAYNVTQQVWMNQAPAEPAYIFYGRTVVGEQHDEFEMHVIVSAVKK